MDDRKFHGQFKERYKLTKSENEAARKKRVAVNFTDGFKIDINWSCQETKT